MMDGLTDDYECWDGERPEAQREDKTVVYVPGPWNSRVELSQIWPRKYRTEVITAMESREVVVLTSGAWKTYVCSRALCGEGLMDRRWTLLLLHFYTDEMTFAPLQSSVPRSDPPPDAKTQWHQPCSPRSVYSLAVSVGILCRFMASGFNKSKRLESKILKIGHLRTSSPNSLL